MVVKGWGSKFQVFLVAINQKRNYSLIKKFRLDDGMVLSSPKEIHEGAISHFKDFLSTRYDREISNLSQLVSVEIFDEKNYNITKGLLEI